MIPKQPHPAKVFTKDLEFEPGLTVIWLLAVFSVGVGSYWSGNVRQQVYECEVHSRQMRRRRLSSSSAASQGAPSRPQGMNVIEEDSSLDISPIWVLSFVVFMATMLVVLYFFIRYLVYFIHGMFVLSASVAVLGVLEPLAYKMPCGTGRLPDGAVPCFHGSLEVRQALVLLAAMAVPAFWIYIRHHPLSWIMQDLLGVCFSVYILRVVRMPNLKICTMLLSILFFYDIFFVFLTPHFIPPAMMHNTTTSFVNATGKGDSIMVEVARGGGSKEQIPMLMRVPRYGNQDISPCLNPYSLLGFGDILVPGLLVAFLRGFDLISVGGCLYFPVALICYGLGLMMTFVGLYLMRTAQPALLYLVPFTVIPTLVIAQCRGELHDLWNGKMGFSSDGWAASMVAEPVFISCYGITKHQKLKLTGRHVSKAPKSHVRLPRPAKASATGGGNSSRRPSDEDEVMNASEQQDNPVFRGPEEDCDGPSTTPNADDECVTPKKARTDNQEDSSSSSA
nr:signal peptide peptidase-like 2B [Rhipicephalus microplus]